VSRGLAGLTPFPETHRAQCQGRETEGGGGTWFRCGLAHETAAPEEETGIVVGPFVDRQVGAKGRIAGLAS
jgi:hypothetical protein